MIEPTEYLVTTVRTIDGIVIEKLYYEVTAPSADRAGHIAMEMLNDEHPKDTDEAEHHVYSIHKKINVDVSRF